MPDGPTGGTTLASLRDVLNHIGKAVRIERAGTTVGEDKAIRRGGQAFVGPMVVPAAGDLLVFVETGERLRVESVEPEEVRGRVDHYKLRLAAV